jgi:hypothetical protein
MATTIDWTPELEERLRAKLEEDYEQADRMVVWASRAKKPLKEGGIIDAKGSAESMIKFIKKELGV